MGIQQKKKTLVEAISLLISDETDEEATEQVSELIVDLVDEAFYHHLLDSGLEDQEEEDMFSFNDDIESFTDEDI